MDALLASRHLIKIELFSQKRVKVETAVLSERFFSSFRVEEKERDRTVLPVLHTALALPHPCFWSKQQREMRSKSLLCKSVFLLEIRGKNPIYPQNLPQCSWLPEG